MHSQNTYEEAAGWLATTSYIHTAILPPRMGLDSVKDELNLTEEPFRFLTRHRVDFACKKVRHPTNSVYQRCSPFQDCRRQQRLKLPKSRAWSGWVWTQIRNQLH